MMDNLKSFIKIFPEKDVSTLIPNNEFTSNLNDWTGVNFAWRDGRAELITSATTNVNIQCSTSSIIPGRKYRLEYGVEFADSDVVHYAAVQQIRTEEKTGNGIFSTIITPQVANNVILSFRYGGNPYTAGYISGGAVIPAKNGASFSFINLYEVDEYVLDTYDDFDLKLNYSIAENSDISKRNSAYSKTITLPGTPNNHRIFRTSYLVTTKNSFPLEYPVRIQITDDDNVILQGYSKLQKIILSQTDSIVKYELTVYTHFIDFYKNIGDYFLIGNDFQTRDLDFSEWDHKLTSSNITSSWWKGSILQGGYSNLPVEPVASGNNVLGTGYTYPLIDWGFTQTSIPNRLMRPAIYVKEIWDKIFNKTGFTYSSTFLNSDRFKRLLYPAIEPITVSQYAAEILNAGYNNTSLFTVNTSTSCGPGGICVTFNFPPTIINTIQQSSGDSALGTGNQYDVLLNGNYSLNVTIDNLSGTVNTQGVFTISICKFSGGIETVIDYRDFTIVDNVTPPELPQSIYVEDIFLQAGDAIYLKASGLIAPILFLGNPTVTSVSIFIDGVDFTVNRIVGSPIYEDDYVECNQLLQNDVKQSDFVTSIIKMFNLYVEPDKNNPFLLYIEPRDIYYSTTTVKDWTLKRDLSRNFIIEEASDLRHKNLLFSYTPDVDGINKYYTDATGDTWGQKFLDADVLTTSTVKIQPLFAPTPQDDFVVPANNGSIITPKIYLTNEDGTVKTDQKYKPRILFWGGIQYWTSDNGVWRLMSDHVGQSITYSKLNNCNFYPYAGHLNKPFGDEDFDLNFGQCQWYFQSFEPISTWVTYKNLYNDYYGRMIDEYLDVDSKMVTAWIYLTGSDIKNIRFNDTIQIDENFYRLNKISNYSPNTVTSVELLKVRQFLSDYIPSPGTGTNGFMFAGPIGRNEGPGMQPPGIGSEKNIHTSGLSRNNIIRGDDITLLSNVTDVTILGSSSVTVGLNSSDSSIISSHNIIFDPNITRVVILNSSDLKIRESGVTYINNVKFKDGRIYAPVHIVNGGKNVTIDPFSAKIPNVVSSGKNSVREMGSYSEVNLIQDID